MLRGWVERVCYEGWQIECVLGCALGCNEGLLTSLENTSSPSSPRSILPAPRLSIALRTPEDTPSQANIRALAAGMVVVIERSDSEVENT